MKRSEEFQQFDDAMSAILRADPTAVTNITQATATNVLGAPSGSLVTITAAGTYTAGQFVTITGRKGICLLAASRFIV